MPDVDGRFLGEATTPRRWDGSRLLGVMRLDGSLPITGSLKMIGPLYAPDYGQLVWDEDNWRFLVKDNYDDIIDLEVMSLYLDYALIVNTSNFYLQTKVEDGAKISFLTWQTAGGGLEGTTVASMQSGRFDIVRGGDIDMLDDKFLKLGKDSDGSLPTPDASYRGKMIRVEGDAGVADKLYICMKEVGDTYMWVQIASG